MAIGQAFLESLKTTDMRGEVPPPPPPLEVIPPPPPLFDEPIPMVDQTGHPDCAKHSSPAKTEVRRGCVPARTGPMRR